MDLWTTSASNTGRRRRLTASASTDPELLNRFQDIAFEVSIPGHPVFDNAFFPVPPFSASDNGHYVAHFDTLTRVPSLNLVQNYAFNYRIKLTPTCESEFGSSDLNNFFKLEPKIHYHDRFYASNIGDGSCVLNKTDGIAQNLSYTDRPIFDFEAVTNPNILIGTDTAVWDIKQCNISTKSDALLTWLSTTYDSTELEVVAIQEVSNPNAIVDFAITGFGPGKKFAITPSLYKNSPTNLPDDLQHHPHQGEGEKVRNLQRCAAHGLELRRLPRLPVDARPLPALRRRHDDHLGDDARPVARRDDRQPAAAVRRRLRHDSARIFGEKHRARDELHEHDRVHHSAGRGHFAARLD